MVSLGALKGASSALQEMHINEIQIHLLDEDGDGVVLCLEYDEQMEELKKTFHSMEEYYTDDEDEGIESFIEEAISEEYEEIFHSSESKPPLLNWVAQRLV